MRSVSLARALLLLVAVALGAASAAPARGRGPKPLRPDPQLERIVDELRQKAPGLPQGSVAVARFVLLDAKPEAVTTAFFGDEEPLKYQERRKAWYLRGVSTTDGQEDGYLIVWLPRYAPGSYTCDGGAVVAALLGGAPWDPTNPKSAYSETKGGWCDVTVTRAANGKDLEGRIRAGLVTNQGGVFILLDEGYFYVKQ
jgi:hypothetical protein